MMTLSIRLGRPRTAVLLTAAALTLSVLPAQQARADHTPVPSTVTLAGSLQSELGCPGDWQAACASTHLSAVPGTR